jgi:hypothetical protein
VTFRRDDRFRRAVASRSLFEVPVPAPTASGEHGFMVGGRSRPFFPRCGGKQPRASLPNARSRCSSPATGCPARRRQAGYELTNRIGQRKGTPAGGGGHGSVDRGRRPRRGRRRRGDRLLHRLARVHTGRGRAGRAGQAVGDGPTAGRRNCARDDEGGNPGAGRAGRRPDRQAGSCSSRRTITGGTTPPSATAVRFAEGPREDPYGTVAVFLDLYGNRWDLVQPRLCEPTGGHA